MKLRKSKQDKHKEIFPQTHNQIDFLKKVMTKKTMVKVVGEKQCMTQKGKMIQMTADFSTDPAEKELLTQNSVPSENIYQE